MDRVILVTGANGFVGRYAVRALSAHHHVVAVDLQDAPAGAVFAGATVKYVQGDLADVSIAAALAVHGPFFAIVHLAGILSKDSSPQTHEAALQANVASTLRVLEVAREHGAAFIFPSTGLVYGDQPGPFTEEMATMPGDFYATSKLVGEQLIGFFSRRFGMRSVILRPSIIYGPGQRGPMFIPSMINALVRGEQFPMTPGEQKRDFVHIDDVVRAIALAIERGDVSGTFNIAAGKSVTICDTALMAQALAGKSGLIALGAVPYRDHEVWDYALDNTKALRELGWRPGVGFEEGLRQTIADALKG